MVETMSYYPQAAPTTNCTYGVQYPYQYAYQPEADMRCQHSSSYLSHTCINTERLKRAKLLYLISQVSAN